MLTRLLIVFTLICSVTLDARAQKEAYNWYFGYGAGLTFHTTPPSFLLGGQTNVLEGITSISDKHGTLQFYSDGRNVWDTTHTLMANGTGLLGNASSTQSGVILPKPGTNNIYGLFTLASNAGTDGFNYNEIDMTLNGGLGDVTAVKNQLIYTPSCEKLAVTAMANGSDYWILVHDWNNDAFRAYPYTSAGLGTPVTTNIGSSYTGSTANSIGQMKISPDGTKVGLVVYGNLAVCEMFDFDRSTGTLSNYRSLTAATGDYGAEWSHDSRYFYTGSYGTGTIWQFDATLGTAAAIDASRTNIYTNSGMRIGQMQLGPDNKIYVGRSGQTHLGCINAPTQAGALCNYVDTAIFLGGPTSSVGLPPFSTTFLIPQDFAYENICFGDTTFFTILDTLPYDSVRWDFGDVASGVLNTDTARDPFHIFTAADTFTVELKVFLGTFSDTLSQEIVIHEIPEVDLGNDTVLCRFQWMELNVFDSSIVSYKWQDDTNSHNYYVQDPGTYWVEVSNGFCQNADTQITQYLSDSTNFLPADTIICPTDFVALDAGTWMDKVTWQDSSNLRYHNAADSGWYWARAEMGPCIGLDSFHLGHYTPPYFDLGEDTAMCDGSALTIWGPSMLGTTQIWQDSSTGSNFQVHTTTEVILEVSDSNCSASDTMMVHIGSIEVAARPDTTINLGDQVTLWTVGGGTAYTWSPADFLDCSDCPQPIATPQDTTLYSVEVVDEETGCSDTSEVLINVIKSAPFFVPDAFSPNGDGINDIYYLYSQVPATVTELEWSVFDRWGEKVFTSTDLMKGWDGTLRGTMMNTGLFVVMFKANFVDGASIEDKKTIKLIR